MNKWILIIGGTSEARKLGTFLAESGVMFTFTLTSKPLREYPFEYEVEKIVDIFDKACRGQIFSTRIDNKIKEISLEKPGFKVRFESYEKVFDLIIDMTHPHACSIGKLLDELDDSDNLSACLWRYQRQSCLKEKETVESYEELANEIVEKNTKRILSFMGCKGSERIAQLLDERRYHCQIFMRSIKISHFSSEFVRLIPMTFSPSEMNNKEILKAMLDEICPELVILKDSGKEGGTDVKRKLLVENDMAFLGLRMPEKKKGRIFRSLEELKSFFVGAGTRPTPAKQKGLFK